MHINFYEKKRLRRKGFPKELKMLNIFEQSTYVFSFLVICFLVVPSCLSSLAFAFVLCLTGPFVCCGILSSSLLMASSNVPLTSTINVMNA